ncbi:DMT family transporter [Paraburkholderia acidisoli]|uniref:EamA family transporter n=1 Tax=Paraburkholderia acidisoli TaxID=2571748 RepID=A0A7Z2GNA9_9BURK|nr:DMT family transporter [Paraburkholderia acidisoli]QGZ64951.1 EamA family transporter [Paraburkholderia acidisoli]
MFRLLRSPRTVDALLVVVALIWGTSYGVVKGALLVYPVLGLLALRFGITFVLLSPALRALLNVGWRERAAVLGAGVLLLGIFLAETFGVSLTRASNAAFLISLCVVFTPLVEWAWLRRAPRAIEWGAAAVSMLGAFLLTGGHVALSAGDALVVLAALLRALTSCAVKRAMGAGAVPPLTITAVQAGVVAFGCAALALTVAPAQWQALPAWQGHAAFWGSVIWLVAACTLFAFFVQNYAVSRSSPTRVALLMGSEPVFGALFAVLWLGERLTVSAWMGGLLIVAASVMALERQPRAAAAAAAARDASAAA